MELEQIKAFLIEQCAQFNIKENNLRWNEVESLLSIWNMEADSPLKFDKMSNVSAQDLSGEVYTLCTYYSENLGRRIVLNEDFKDYVAETVEELAQLICTEDVNALHIEARLVPIKR